MAESRRRRSVSTSFLLELLADQLARLDPAGAALEVVDLGGGTGGVAIALAGQGHRVTVIDPSPDALASLERRTAESGLEGRIVARQGDAADLVDVVGERSTDVVVCHRVLEVVESPQEALAAMAAVLRPGGALSLLASQRRAAVLGHALAGHLALARRAWADRSRFDHDGLVELVTAAGFTVQASHGIGAVSEHVAESVVDGEPGAYAELKALEAEVSQDPAFRALAPQVHLFARVGLTTPAAVD
jgi:S-adenosylmethionine-dependent methyltransferase